MSSFFGPGVEIEGFGPVPDCDALAMYLIQVWMCLCVYVCMYEGGVSISIRVLVQCDRERRWEIHVGVQALY